MLLVSDLTWSSDFTRMAAHEVMEIVVVVNVADQILQTLGSSRTSRLVQRADCKSIPKKELLVEGG
jgi:hypothetical protein